MKPTFCIAILVVLSSGPFLAQNIQFNDVKFKNALAFNSDVDKNMNGEISIEEASMATSLHIPNRMISDMTEIKYFTNLKMLNCSFNQLTTLDVSALTNLEILFCRNNQLTTLDASSLVNLKFLYCDNNQLTSLFVSGLTKVEEIYCTGNNLIMIDLRETKLEYINASVNPLKCVVINPDSKPNLKSGFSVSIYTTEPCLATFETLTHLVENSEVVDYQRTILLTALRSVEAVCSLGSKKATILLLFTMSGTIQLWQQWGAIDPEAAMEIRDEISLLIDGIQSGEVDCSPDDLWDQFTQWSFLDDTLHAGNGLHDRTHTISSDATLRLYPNPTPGMVNLSRSAQEVHVYNLLGQQLFQARDVDRLDLSMYEVGVYVIRIGSGRDGSVHRVIRQ